MNIINVYCPVWHYTGAQIGTMDIIPMFVMTQDALGQFACYAGFAQLPQPSEENYDLIRDAAAHQIASQGSKLNYRQACGFFSGFSEEDYRA